MLYLVVLQPMGHHCEGRKGKGWVQSLKHFALFGFHSGAAARDPGVTNFLASGCIRFGHRSLLLTSRLLLLAAGTLSFSYSSLEK